MDDAYILENFETLSLISDTNEAGIPWRWFLVKNELKNNGINALNLLFDYYQEFNTNFDPWCNFLISKSHFTDEEMTRNHKNRRVVSHLEQRVHRIIKQEKENQNITMEKFLNNYVEEFKFSM